MTRAKTVATLAILGALIPVAAVPAQQPGAQEAAATPAPPKPADLGLFVYPAQKQTKDVQSADEAACYGWARQQTGIDPTAPPTEAQAVDVPKGGAVKGAAGGALVGTAVGAVVGETGEGAAIGAIGGAAKGRRAQKKAEKQAKKKAQETAQAKDAQAKDTFKKAWGACLEGRGYSVK
jgi:hypothetical protein